MLTQIDIRNFRGLRELSLSSAGCVNLVVGRNDTGKTSLLEAIRVLMSGDPRFMRRAIRNRLERRPLNVEQDYRVAFYAGNVDAGLEIVGSLAGRRVTATARFEKIEGEVVLEADDDDEGGTQETDGQALQPHYEVVVEVSASGDDTSVVRQPLRPAGHWSQRRRISPTFPVIPLPVWLGTNRPEAWAYARRYSDLYRSGGAPILLDILKAIEPRLSGLVVLTGPAGAEPSTAVLEVDLGLGPSLPLESMGEGFCSIISILSAIGSAKGGICLIDELENGVHYTFLPQLWRAVLSAAKSYGAQVWATTHSNDCIVAAAEAFGENPEMLRVHRLERRDNGSVIAHSFDHKTLVRALERGLEVR